MELALLVIILTLVTVLARGKKKGIQGKRARNPKIWILASKDEAKGLYLKSGNGNCNLVHHSVRLLS